MEGASMERNKAEAVSAALPRCLAACVGLPPAGLPINHKLSRYLLLSSNPKP